MNLIPPVKQMAPARGVCCMGAMRRLRCAGVNEETESLLKERFPDLKVVRSKKGFFAEFTSGKSGMSPADAGAEADAYVLRVTEDCIRIDAASAGGLFYGIQTLLQFPSSVQCSSRC